jgi:endonuclease YncB( thermonuclease family)
MARRKHGHLDLYVYGVYQYWVTDGDTIKCMFDYGNKDYTMRGVRIIGINTPEKFNTDKDPKKNEKRAGLLVKQVTQALLAEKKRIYARSIKRDPYEGRTVGSIFWLEFDDNDNATEVHLGAWLLEKGLAKEYGGDGKKPPFSEEELANVIEACHEVAKENTWLLEEPSIS